MHFRVIVEFILDSYRCKVELTPTRHLFLDSPAVSLSPTARHDNILAIMFWYVVHQHLLTVTFVS